MRHFLSYSVQFVNYSVVRRYIFQAADSVVNQTIDIDTVYGHTS
jgi:hypothetical protein